MIDYEADHEFDYEVVMIMLCLIMLWCLWLIFDDMWWCLWLIYVMMFMISNWCYMMMFMSMIKMIYNAMIKMMYDEVYD